MKKSPDGKSYFAINEGTFDTPLSMMFSKKASIDRNPVIGRKIVLKRIKKKFRLKIDLSQALFLLKSSRSTIHLMMNGTNM